MDEEGITWEIQGIQRPLKLRPVTTSQLEKRITKGFQINAIQVGYTNSKENSLSLENILVVQNLLDVFPEEILRLSLKRDIDFTMS